MPAPRNGLYIIRCGMDIMPKVSLIISACLFSVLVPILTGQQLPLPYEYSYTSAPAAMTQFDFDIADSLLADTSNHHALYYREPAATFWNTQEITFLYHACTTYTFSTQLHYQPAADALEWYFRSENDTAVVSQVPKNSDNQFPVPLHLLADLGADPIGDPQNTTRTNLDITHFYAGYSETRLYFRFDNNGGGYPTSSGLFTYFVYSVGLVDPDATDSVAYVLVYANVPAIFNPGLYRLNPADSSFSLIGSITYNISGNSLSLSCSISDLIAQPEWSDWPPPSGFIGCMAVTATQTLSGLETNDLSKAGVLAPKSNFLIFSAPNQAPLLSNSSLNHIGGGEIEALIQYTDADNHLPVVRSLIFDGMDYPMVACVKNYDSAATFEFSPIVSASGWYPYYFIFSDGVEVVQTLADSIYIEFPSYICGDANGDQITDISDAVHIINYIFLGTPPPQPPEAGDANCDSIVDISDAVWLVNFVFAGGNAPCDVDGDSIPEC